MSQTEKDRFLAVFPKIQAELLDFLEANFMPEDAKAWFKKVSNVGGQVDETLLRLIFAIESGIQRSRWKTQPWYVRSRHGRDIARRAVIRGRIFRGCFAGLGC